MTRKIHLRRNVPTGNNPDIAACASNPYVAKARANGRRTYQFMASEIVSYAAFQNVPEADRCAHCMDVGLVVRNRQRKAKGLPLVKHLFEK